MKVYFLAASLALVLSASARADSCTVTTNGSTYTTGSCFNVASGQTVTINLFSASKSLTNSCGIAVAVPTNSATEWTDFRTTGPACITGGTAGCTAQTISNCTLSAVSSGSSSGTCASGYSGSCSYSCSNGSWSMVSNSCAAAISCGGYSSCSAWCIANGSSTPTCSGTTCYCNVLGANEVTCTPTCQ